MRRSQWKSKIWKQSWIENDEIQTQFNYMSYFSILKLELFLILLCDC